MTIADEENAPVILPIVEYCTKIKQFLQSEITSNCNKYIETPNNMINFSDQPISRVYKTTCLQSYNNFTQINIKYQHITPLFIESFYSPIRPRPKRRTRIYSKYYH